MGFLDFIKKNKKYDIDGFDSEGYNRLGYDHMGYDRSGYDINGYNRDGYNIKGIYKLTGRDAEGYDEQGFDEHGLDRYGFNVEGYDKEGYDRDGYNRNGYDKNGYNNKGFDISGYDRDGYDDKGFNRGGYDRNGFNKEGYNLLGRDRNGYDKKGFDEEGFDRFGYDINGFDCEGYDKDGFNKNGFDRDGYNKKGYNKEGYNKEGYNKRGYDKAGYTRDGFDKHGYDKDGYDEEGYNKEGIDRNGYDKDGYDSDGYDRNGYNKKGFDRNGFSKLGFHIDEFDADGYHKITGLDVYGYSKYGFNINGINKHTGRDRLGFNADGIDENGFNIWGFDIANQLDRFGDNIEKYEADPNMSTEECERFEELYYQYMAGKKAVAVKLASCYCYGKGTVKDYKKALRVLVDVAFEYRDLEAIRDLADHFYIGDIIGQNIALSNYLNDIVDNKENQSINQYKARQALEFQRPKKEGDGIFAEEAEHLERVMQSIDKHIEESEKKIRNLDNDTSWMDFDQLQNWRVQKARNIEAKNNIEEYNRIKSRPYYARMDAQTSRGKETFYIGELRYMDFNNPTCNILSVWSDVGARYRDSGRTQFNVNGYNYKVLLRRKLDIVNGQLIDYYDEYSGDSNAAKVGITDPYLLRILEQKRGEKNITNIIRSIQVNQNEIIETDFHSNIVIQGCAGSGKTMILLHRLANMKYNQKNYDWSKVKIITPNKDFTFFVDELSKNLKIDEIDKVTLQEYYLAILGKYDKQYPERVRKGSEMTSVTYFNYNNEVKKIKDDSELDIEIRQQIFSEVFRKKILEEATTCKKNINNYREASEQFLDVFLGIMDGLQCKVPKRMSNYSCYLYSKILFMYFVFGAINSHENMLCIDEGQDICEMQYLLLYEVNGKNTCMNIYGDMAQRIPSNVSLTSWDKLKKIFKADYFELNENYRNSEEIIDFYGKKLGIKNGSFGLKTKAVEQFLYEELDILLKLQLILGNRVVIISNSENVVPKSILSLCTNGGIAENQISVMNVKQVKGLEFDTAFIFDDDMDKNEKYIAYTRALSELYVFSPVQGQQRKALDIQREIVPSKSTKINKTENTFPMIMCKEEAVFYDYTTLYSDREIFITLTYPEIIDDCFVIKMALRIDDPTWISSLAITANDFAFDETIQYNKIPVYVPNAKAEEQLITFSIPLDKLPDYICKKIIENPEQLQYGFSLDVKYATKDGEMYDENSEYIIANMDGEFVVDEESEASSVVEITSITDLNNRNSKKLLIVVRESWSNDFCFVVEELDGYMARGSQYLNGKFHKKSAYNKYWKEFKIYTGPSREKIEEQY